jgi:site-specific DNA-methyltransferase (adenine-specific)/site-specific DNA-methyltransferase (cytosine-N4-specific)
MGSGTTIEVAHRMRRHAIGIEIVPEYFYAVEKQFAPLEYLFRLSALTQ